MEFRYWVLMMGALVVLGFALRAYRLDGQSLWSDEFISLERSSQPLATLIATMPPEHAPLYFVVLHFWLVAVGTTSDFALRYLSVVFSLLAVPLIARLGARLFDWRVGLATTFLMAVNPFQVWYAQEARMYALVLTAGLASVLLLVEALERGGVMHPLTGQSPRVYWAGYVVMTMVALYTHYYAFLLLAVEGVFAVWWLWRRGGRGFTPWATSQAAIALLYLPWLPQALRLLSFPGWRPPLDLASLPARYFTAYTVGTSVSAQEGRWLAAGFAVFAAAGLVTLLMDGIRRDLLTLLWLIVPMAIATLLALRNPDFHERYFIVITPALYLLIARGALIGTPPSPPADARAGSLGGRLQPAFRSLLAVIFVSFVAFASFASLRHHYFDLRYAKPAYRQVARHLQAHSRPGDGLILNGPEREYLGRYYGGPLPPNANLAGSRYQGRPDEVRQVLSRMAAQHPRLWLAVEFHDRDAVQEWLTRNGYLVERFAITDQTLYLFAFPRDEGARRLINASEVAQKGPVALRSYSVTPQPVPSGEILHLTLRWRADEQPRENYKVALRLVDSEGHVYVSVDRPPVDGFTPTSRWQPGEVVEDRYGLLLPPGTPPGAYRLQVKLYEEQSWAEALTAILGPLTVTRAVYAPPVEALDIAEHYQVAIGERLTLLGHAGLPEKARPGDQLTLTLLWCAGGPLSDDSRLTLTLRDKASRQWESTWLLSSLYPPSQWVPDELVRLQYDWMVPATAEGGPAQLSLNLVEGASGQPLASAGVPLARLTVDAPPRRFSVPSIQHPMRVDLGDSVTFLGYAVAEKQARPGGSAHLTLYWQARQPQTVRSGTGYTVFVHLLDPAGQIRGQVDRVPAGNRPTTGWVAGEVVVDEYVVPIAADAPPGSYRFAIGLYNPTTGQRLPVVDAAGQRLADDRILFPAVEIKP